MKTKKQRQKIYAYSESDYMSGDGMLTNVWGPSMWHFLHTMSFNYPVSPTDEDKKNYKAFITNLQYTLPCKFCRINLVKNLKELPMTNAVMKSRATFSRYVYDLHNLINKMLKKTDHISFLDVRDRYENFRDRCVLKNKTVKKREKGCTEPLYGKKSKCIIKIVPQDKIGKSFQMDKQCFKKKI